MQHRMRSAKQLRRTAASPSDTRRMTQLGTRRLPSLELLSIQECEASVPMVGSVTVGADEGGALHMLVAVLQVTLPRHSLLLVQ